MNCYSLLLELLCVDGWMDEWTEKHGQMSRHIFASFHCTCTNSGEWSSQLCFTDLDVIGRLLRVSEYRFLKIVVREVNCLTLSVLYILQSLLIHVNVYFSTSKLFDLWGSNNYHTYFYIGLCRHCAIPFFCNELYVTYCAERWK